MNKNDGLGVVKSRLVSKAKAFKKSMKFHKDETTTDRIFYLLIGECRKEVRKYFAHHQKEAEQIKSVIQFFVQNDYPVPMTITFALYMRAKNSFKFLESNKNFPHLGWADFLGKFWYINEKIKTFYAPGLRLFIFEEASLFYPVLNWQREDVEKFEAVVKRIIKVIDMEDMLIIAPMGEMNFPTWDDWHTGISFEYASEHVINDSVVFAMMTSCEEFDDRCLMDCLYSQLFCDYEMIKSIYRDLWQKAYLKAAYVRHVMDMRKSQNLWGKHVQGFYHTAGLDIRDGDFLDAVITYKPGRLSLNMGMVLPNHGMMVLDSKGGQIVPEYRLLDGEAKPVKANEAGEEFTFYYEV